MASPVNATRFDDESTLVLLLSDPHLAPEDVDRVSALCLAPLDWNRVLGMLVLHRTAGQAWANLVDHDLANAAGFRPSSAILTLRSLFQSQRLYLREQTDRNVELTNRFEAAGIRSVMMKGAAVAAMGYTQPGVRTFIDNDVLFDRDDIPRVGEILKAAGYIQGGWDSRARVVKPAPRDQILLHPLTSHETFPYTIATPEAWIGAFHCVDVHFSLDLMTANRDDEAVRELMGRRVAVPGNDDGEMWVLDREDMFVFLCVHYHREGTNRREAERLRDLLLYKIMDLLALLGDKARPLDADLIARRAKEAGFEREVYFALNHLEELYPGRAPAGLLDSVRPDGSIDFVRQIMHNGEPVHTWSSSVAERFFAPDRLAGLSRG
jgi:hypothetical protein